MYTSFFFSIDIIYTELILEVNPEQQKMHVNKSFLLSELI